MPSAMGAIEAVQCVLQVLRAIHDEWEDCKREDVEARKVSDVLGTVIPKLKAWAKSKEQLTRGESQLIAALKQDADDIWSWLSAYKEEGSKNGYFARGLKMAKNAAKKAVGIETSHAQLLDLVGELEQKLKTLQIVVAFDIHAGIAQVLQKQQELMDQVQKRLQALPSGLEVPRDTAEAIAELVGMEIGQPDSAEGSAERKAWVARVVNDLRVDNRELWGQVHEKLDHIGAEVHETNRGVQDLHRKFDLHMNLGGNVKASNTKAADFWKTYFTGTDNVTWKIFVIALKEEFSFDDHSLDLIRSYLDVDADGSISILEFNVRTAKDGVEGTCLKALQGPSNMNKGAVPTEVLPPSPSRSLPPSLPLSPDLSLSRSPSLPPKFYHSIVHSYVYMHRRPLPSIPRHKHKHRVSLSVIVCVCVHELYS